MGGVGIMGEVGEVQFLSPTKPTRAHSRVCEHKFARNKDYKGLFTLHYLTNFYLTMNYFVNMLCYKAVNQCSVISNWR